MATDNHGMSKPEAGVTGWDTDWYQNFDYLDTNAEIRDAQAERSGYVAKDGAKFFSTDTHNIFLGTGTQGWEKVPSAGPNPTLEDVSAGSLTVGPLTADVASIGSELELPAYDSIANAPATTGSVIYVTGADDTAGVYYYGPNGYEIVGSGSGGSGGDESVGLIGGHYTTTGNGVDTTFSWDSGAVLDTGEEFVWMSVDASTSSASTDFTVSSSGSTITVEYARAPNDGASLGWYWVASTTAEPTVSGGSDGAGSLSELTIDTNKDWRGFDITNTGHVSGGTAAFNDGTFGGLSVSTAPAESFDVVRQAELNGKADDPHGNEAHSETYLTESDLDDSGTGAPSPHDNTHHSETYATTTQVDARATDPHDNEAHSTNYAPSGHDHSSGTIRPAAIESDSITTGDITIGTAGPIDGLGENVYISEGKLSASGEGSTATGKSHVDFHDIDDYGADPTGSNYSDAALSDAITALNDGDWLVMTNGNYRFQGSHAITNNYITLTGEGSLITNENDDYTGSTGFISFRGDVNSSGSPDTTNSSAIQPGDQAISVNSSAGFSMGDDVIIAQQKGPDNTHYRWGGQDGRTVAQTRSTVRAVDGNTIYLTRGSSYFHSSDSAGVYQVDPCLRPRVYDMHMRSSGGASTETFLVFYFTRHGEMRRCYAQNYTGFPYQLFYGFRDTLVDCVAKHPVETTDRNSSQHEVMRLVGGTDPVLVRPIIEDCRRGIDLNAGTHVAKIYEPLITNAQLHGVCFHSQDYSTGVGDVYGGYEIHGGRIETKQQVVNNSLYHAGLGASMSRQQTGVKLIGTTIVGRAGAIHTPSYANGEADNVVLKDCTFESVPEYSGGDLVKIGGSNWTIEGCTLRPNGGQNAITNVDSGFNSVRILNNQIEGDVDLSGATIDGYWFKNNYHTGSGAAPSGTSHFASDNY